MDSSGIARWVLWGVALVLIVIAGVWIRGMNQQRVDARELAFRSLSRKLGLSKKETSALRSIAERDGVHPVGLLMSPSAVRANLHS
jgi:cytochrome c-type biogenesis protein CcmH/NrfF